MNIVYISHWRFPSEKTMSPLIMKTCEGFARSGHRVELWIPRRRNLTFRGVDPFEYHGIERIFRIRPIPVIDLLGIFPGSFWFYLLVASFNISVFANCLKSDFKQGVFYFHDARDALGISFLGRPTFLEIHDFYKSNIRWINAQVFPRLWGFIVTNKIKMRALETDFGIPIPRMLHQPNAVDMKMFSIDISKERAREKLGLPMGKRIILYTGHLFDWKGVDTLFDAHQFFNADEIIYFVGGTDEDIEKFKVKSEMLKVENVVIVGRRPHDEIPLWLRAADMLVLPNTAKDEVSRVETSPVKLFEYMASGRPIIASDIPSIRNVVDESMVFFAEADNSRSFADAVHKGLSDSEGADRRAEQARREAQKYSWERRNTAILEFVAQQLKTAAGRKEVS
mgnify:FL=1